MGHHSDYLHQRYVLRHAQRLVASLHSASTLEVCQLFHHWFILYYWINISISQWVIISLRCRSSKFECRWADQYLSNSHRASEFSLYHYVSSPFYSKSYIFFFTCIIKVKQSIHRYFQIQNLNIKICVCWGTWIVRKDSFEQVLRHHVLMETNLFLVRENGRVRSRSI